MTSDQKPNKSKPIIVTQGLLILGLILIILLTANSAENKFNEGFYQGQLKVYYMLEKWNYGKVVYHEGNSEFQFHNPPYGVTGPIYMYNRNHYPDQLEHPNGPDVPRDIKNLLLPN